MSTISVTNINDGDAVTAASVNNQINTIVNDYNGNITAANLASNAVTDAKITANNLLATKFSNPYKFSVYRAAAQTPGIGNVVQFDTKIFDTGSNVDIVTNKGRFTAPVAGFYLFTTNLAFTVTAASQDVGAQFKKNGSLVNTGGGYINMYAGSSSNASVTPSVLLQLAANDYIEVIVNTALALSVGVTNCVFSGFLVSSI